MVGFDMVNINTNSSATCRNGQIRFYYNEANPKTLYLHFQTAFDEVIIEQMLCDRMQQLMMNKDVDVENADPKDEINSFHSFARTKFAQMLLFAIQICHVIVLVETNGVFDTSYLSIFKALKVIRYAFLPIFLFFVWIVTFLFYISTEKSMFYGFCPKY